MPFVWFSVTWWILRHNLSLKWQKIWVISIFGMIPSVSLTFDLQCIFSICNPISPAIDFITLVVAMDYSNLANSHFLWNIENANLCYYGNCFCEYLNAQGCQTGTRQIWNQHPQIPNSIKTATILHVTLTYKFSGFLRLGLASSVNWSVDI